MSEWTLPSRAEQEKHLNEIGAVLGGRVRFLTSNFEWEVYRWLQLGSGENGSLSVQLASPTTGRKRSAWPWELRAAA